MSCDECRALGTHKFESPSDLLNAMREASNEVERGVLLPLSEGPGRKSLPSFIELDEMPEAIRYRFQCRVCGDRFELCADMQTGRGGWLREGEGDLGEGHD